MSDYWTDEKINILRNMVKDGNSMREIALVLGCSRNAVIGKWQRIRIAEGHQPLPKVKTPCGKSKTARERPGSASKADGGIMPVLRLSPPKRPRRAIGILDVTGCKWPVGYNVNVPGGHTFCNAALHDDRYCEYHVKESGAHWSDELIKKTVNSVLSSMKRAA